MSITRALGVLFCLLPLHAGCVEPDDEAPPDEVTTEPAHWEAQPFCTDQVVTKVRYEACGLAPDLEHTLYRRCTQTCTTKYKVVFTPAGTSCVQDGLTFCTLWQCGPCGG